MGPPTTETSTTSSTLRAPLLPALELVILLQIAIPVAGAPSPITDHLGVATLATPIALLRRDVPRTNTNREMPHVSARSAPYTVASLYTARASVIASELRRV